VRFCEPDEEPGPAADESVRIRKRVAAPVGLQGVLCGRRSFFHLTALRLAVRDTGSSR
jgi:hypothetical protein